MEAFPSKSAGRLSPHGPEPPLAVEIGRMHGRVWQLRNPGVSTLPTLHKLANEGSPRTKTRIYAVEPRPASAEGTLPDVRGRRADAYRHCVVAGCRLSMDLTTNAIGFLMAHPGRWVDLALWLHAVFLRIGLRTSARFQVWSRVSSRR